MSVVFDFNASLNDFSPVSPIMFTDDFMKKGKSVDCQMILCAVSLSSLLRFSSVSAVFDFNASLNDVAPVFPMLFTDELNENGKELIVDGWHLCVVSFVLTTQIKYCKCCV